MLKIEIEVNKCLDLINKQKTVNFFFGIDQITIDTDFLIQKGILIKKSKVYILQENYLDIISQELLQIHE